MPDTKNEQEDLEIGEVVDLLAEKPDENVRKGYEDYLKEAEEEAAAQEDGKPNEDDSKDNKDDSSTLPDKFKGKTAEEIAASYVELQTEYGRKSTEVGSLRNQVDTFLELKGEKQEETAATSVDDLLDNPGDTINSVVDSNPRLKQIEETLAKQEVQKGVESLAQEHSNWEETLNSKDFADWVMESPIRKRVFAEAIPNDDFTTTSELLSMFNLSKGKDIEEAKKSRNKDARAAAKNSVTENGGSDGTKAKPRYKRAELIKLKQTNPAKYERLKDEIYLAYQEKRVI